MSTLREHDALDVAFVNNMPDAAFEATESQFERLLADSAGEIDVRVSRYTIASLPRSTACQRRAAGRYEPVESLYLSGADAVIVTGTEPRTRRLQDEACWEDLVQLVRWSLGATHSALLSCLTAHVAATDLDGLGRAALPSKLSGVFSHLVDPSHPLGAGMARRVPIPHSRLNEVPTAALRDAGYRIVVSSGAEDLQSGWTLAAKDAGRCMLVLVQGHPEYDRGTLLGEYRRDVRRYLRSERADYPELPENYFSSDAEMVLAAFENRSRSAPRPEAFLAERFPYDRVAEGLGWPWRRGALGIYSNWLREVARRVGSDEAGTRALRRASVTRATASA